MKVKKTKKHIEVSFKIKRKAFAKWMKRKVLGTIIMLAMLSLFSAAGMHFHQQPDSAQYSLLQTLNADTPAPSA